MENDHLKRILLHKPRLYMPREVDVGLVFGHDLCLPVWSYIISSYYCVYQYLVKCTYNIIFVDQSYVF